MDDSFAVTPLYIWNLFKIIICFNITRNSSKFLYILQGITSISIWNRNITPFPIDIVYLWVNASEPYYIAQKRETARKFGINITKANINKELDFDELKYSIRSVENFAPWIRNIYILSKTPGPNWLNFSHPRLHYINDDDITPKGQVYFDSARMIRLFPYIHGLSEYFIFSSDDYFFGNQISYTDFFTSKGIPKYQNFVIFNDSDSALENKYNEFQIKAKTNLHDINLFLAQNFQTLIQCRKELKKKCIYYNYHVQTPLRRSYGIEVNQMFRFNSLNILMFNRSFRHMEDLVSENLLANYAILLKGAQLYQVNEKQYYSTSEYKILPKGSKNKSKMFCINSGTNSNDKERNEILKWLKVFMPKPSQYENI